jgi:diguanylate cyclase (GGDEF)-like protein/PAS domain S-box-containing protein
LLRRLRGGTEKKQRPGYRSLVRHAPEVIFVLDADFIVRYASPSSRQVLGYQSGYYLGTGFVQHLHPEESARVLESIASEAEKPPDASAPVLFIMRHADGSWRHIEAVCADLRRDPEVRGIACYVRDVTDRVKLQNLLYHRAFHDSLTGLPNRALLMDRIEQGLARTARHREQLLAVLFIDLNNFKTINDRWGHAVGDQALATTGQRLRACLRPSDTAARLGGDEFAVLLPEVSGEGEAVLVAKRILRALQDPIHLGDRTYTVQVSMGIATTQDPRYRQAEMLLHAADKAMYEAKATRGPGYAVFKDRDPENSVRHLTSRLSPRTPEGGRDRRPGSGEPPW